MVKGLGLFQLWLSMGDGLGSETSLRLGIQGSSSGHQDAPWKQSGPRNQESPQSQILFRNAGLQGAGTESGGPRWAEQAQEGSEDGRAEAAGDEGKMRSVQTSPSTSLSFSVPSQCPPPPTGPRFYSFYIIPSIKKNHR